MIHRIFFAIAALTTVAADWPGFLGPNQDLTSPERGIVWPPKKLWSLSAGEGYTGPAVVAGRLFLFDRVGATARLRCVRADDATTIWTASYVTDYVDRLGFDGGPRTSPVVANGRVFVFGPEGVLAAFAADTGKELWRVDTTKQYNVVQNFFGAGSTPWVEGDRLIVAVGGSPSGPEPENFMALRANGSAIAAFDVSTGKEVWKSGDDLAAYSSPFVVDQNGARHGYYFARAGLIGFDPKNGRTDRYFAWRAPVLDSVNAANPVVRGNEVFISETYGPGSALLRLQPGGFGVVWSDRDKGRNPSLQCHWARPILAGEHLFACSGRHSSNAELRCVDWATGTVKWREPGLARTTLIGVDGNLIVLSEFGLLLRVNVNPARYEELGRIDLGAKGSRQLQHYCWAPPVLSDGRLYLRGKSELLCLELIPRKV
ncbi:MAG: PQQ-like beta-propeller repeat protein [Gemmataceae bacterium]|nr:PQQ-like beta-propeller repeat protein [Gemmataceae bacterium]